jgi:hypothetical protein
LVEKGLADENVWHLAAKELNLDGTGRIDLLFIDDACRPILVETKLITNPEARRQVVTQVAEYNLQLSRSTTGRLLRGGVTEALRDREDEIDDYLRRGDVDLLIVGDAFDERAIRLASAIFADQVTNRATLTFIELCAYRSERAADGIFLVPRVRHVLSAETRHVIEVRVLAPERDLSAEVEVEVKPPAPAASAGRATLRSEELMTHIAARGKAARDAARKLLEQLPSSLGAQVYFRRNGASVRLKDPRGTDQLLTLYVVSAHGTF